MGALQNLMDKVKLKPHMYSLTYSIDRGLEYDVNINGVVKKNPEVTTIVIKEYLDPQYRSDYNRKKRRHPMTKQERKEMMHDVFEKGWAQSKKFIAFFLVDAMLAAMAIIALIKQDTIGWPLSAFMVGIVFVMGFVAVSFNSRQADVDKFVRMAALNYKGASNAEERNVPATEPDGTGK
jgi:hypothetical protein